LESKIEAEASNILIEVDRFLTEKQIEAYLVGGFVRDTLIGRTTADIDIAVKDDALKIAMQAADELQGTYVPLDDINRVARVAIRSQSGLQINKQWYIDFSTIVEDIGKDLARRDFTVNALAANLHSCVKNLEIINIIDPFNGQADLKRKSIQAVNERVFEADPARLLRAVRLAAELGFTISVETESTLIKSSSLIKNVAGERIREELLRILANSKAGFFIRYLDELGLLTAIIPELEPSRGVEQPVEHHWDVLNHSLETVCTAGLLLKQDLCSYAGPDLLKDLTWNEKISRHFSSEIGGGSARSSLFKLAALLHDIAKPETKLISKDRVRFFGHTEQGAEVVVRVLERLRFSNKEIKLVEAMVRYHMRPTQMSNEGMPSRKAIYRFFRDSGSAGLDILFLSLADHLAARGPDLDMTQWKWHIEQVNFILNEYFRQASELVPSKLVDGHDLIRLFHLQPGPKIREILELVKEAQAAGEIINRDQALSYIKNHILYSENKNFKE
jgi:poly(A) polymerase